MARGPPANRQPEPLSRSILEGRSRTVVSLVPGHKLDQIAVSDFRTLRGLTQFLTHFGFAGSATGL